MRIIERIAEELRANVSRHALDFAETLPKFQSGCIYRMQSIRESQRKIASQLAIQSKTPDNANIKIKSITIICCYEFEQFSSVHQSLKKAFPENKRLLEAVDEIRKDEKKLDVASWSNLATIVGEGNRYLIFDAIKQAELPSNIERIQLSHHRLLSSLACLEFTIIVSEPFQEKIQSVAECCYLPKTISASLRPSMLFKGYSTSAGGGAARAVSDQLHEFIRDSSGWLLNFLKIDRLKVHICAAHPLYQIVSSSQESLEDYAKLNGAWLSKYGYRNDAYHRYCSDSLVLCINDQRNDLSPKIDPLFFVGGESDHFSLLIDGVIKGLVASSALLTRLAVYKTSIESLRSKGLMDLTGRWRVIRNSGETVYSLKHIILRLKRSFSEFRRSKLWLLHSFDEAASLKMSYFGKESTFSSNTFDFVESELTSLTESATMLDEALSDRLATENIYVMYQLQRRVFWLTVVGVFVAAIGLVSAWDKIKPYIHSLFPGGV